MFQCYSLNSSYPLLPLLWPQVCPLCLHLYDASLHLLYSIFMHLYVIFVFLFLTLLCVTDSRSIHISKMTQFNFFLWLSNIPFYIWFDFEFMCLFYGFVYFFVWLLAFYVYEATCSGTEQEASSNRWGIKWETGTSPLFLDLTAPAKSR